ncbi:MAG: ABC transporter ATP-binding protein [Phycisphaeraceae bacterium]
MIELNDITFAYDSGGFTLKAEALSIAQGEKIAVVGHSGSGKTTLLHLIAGILVPTGGKVQVDGQAVSSISDQARRRIRLTRMGLVFQGIELIDYLSAIENVLLPYRINQGLTLDARAKQRAKQLLERVGLSEQSGRAVSGLSQGERQRVGICRALVAQPSVILADEPTSSLDDESAASALDLLLELVEESDATLVILTHDKTLLQRFDRVVTVDRGEVSEKASGVVS